MKTGLIIIGMLGIGLRSFSAWAEEGIVVEPASPTTADKIAITVSIDVPTPCDFLVLDDPVIVGQTIQISGRVKPPDPDVVCVTVIGLASASVQIDRLEAGEYEVEVVLERPWGEPMLQASLRVVQSTVVTVTTWGTVKTGMPAGWLEGVDWKGSSTTASSRGLGVAAEQLRGQEGQ